MNGMKSQDLVVLLKLASLEETASLPATAVPDRRHALDDAAYSVRNLEALLGISKTEIGASIKRSLFSGLAIRNHATGRPSPNRHALFDFIVRSLRYVFPVKPGAMTRGVPTAFAAPMLKGLVVGAGEYVFVWPHPEGRMRGQSVEPLFRSVPAAAARDDLLYEYLALADALRLGNQRERGVAANRLAERLRTK